MRLFEKGEISFVFLWVLNPIVILLFQNCSPSNLNIETTKLSSKPAPACSPGSVNCPH